METSRYLIFHLVKHADSFYAQTAQEEADSQQKINDFFRSWSPKVRQILGSHAMNLSGEWDWMGVFTMDELSDWEAFREEYRRRFPSRVVKSLSLPGVSHSEFERATKDIEHYKKLRELGQFPGDGEKLP